MGMLGQTENGEKINAKSLFYSALRTPAFIGTVLGIIVGLTRMITRLLDSPFGNCYLSVENILTTAITPIILIVVGYSMELAPELISPCLKTILLRVLLQAVMIAGVLMAVKYLVGGSRLLNLAVITYMSSPATFSMQTFLRKKESSAYASTTNSLYCVVSILVYITLAVAGCGTERRDQMTTTTLCYIENDDKFLMLHRVKKQDDMNEGKWIGVGGHVESQETPEEWPCREVKEETGLTLTSYKFRGLVTFINSECESELMCVFTADEYTGELIECDEGELCWVDKAMVPNLPAWEGDQVFLDLLLSGEKRFFSVKLQYEGDRLVEKKIHLY